MESVRVFDRRNIFSSCWVLPGIFDDLQAEDESIYCGIFVSIVLRAQIKAELIVESSSTTRMESDGVYNPSF